MSIITNVIVLGPSSEDNDDSLVALGLTKLNDHIKSDRAFEADMWAGAFNYLDLDDLIKKLAAIPWTEPEYVQLLTQGQAEMAFTLWRIRSGKFQIVNERT